MSHYCRSNWLTNLSWCLPKVLQTLPLYSSYSLQPHSKFLDCSLLQTIHGWQSFLLLTYTSLIKNNYKHNQRFILERADKYIQLQYYPYIRLNLTSKCIKYMQIQLYKQCIIATILLSILTKMMLYIIDSLVLYNNKLHIQTVNFSMIQIHKLQDFYKARRKSPNPQFLLQILDSVQDAHVCISLNQKGIILQLLAKVCLSQYQLFSKTIMDFQDYLQGGKFNSPKDRTTAKKRRDGGGRGNTTTVKKKKQDALPEIPRQAIDLDEMLEIQLSAAKSVEIQSSNKSSLSKFKGEANLPPPMQNFEFPTLHSQQFLTPFKPIEDAKYEIEEKNFDQYRQLLNITSKKKERTNTKNKSDKTRKKLRVIQPIPQQINSHISLQLPSQISLRKQIQNILQATKKKKSQQKENLYNYQTIKIQSHAEIASILQNRENITKFNKEYIERLRTDGLYSQGLSQRSNYPNLLDDFYGNEYNESLFAVFERKQELTLSNLDQQLSQESKITFNTFAKKLSLGKEDKANFFYKLLCESEKYKLQQPQIDSFGQISISLIQSRAF